MHYPNIVLDTNF